MIFFCYFRLYGNIVFENNLFEDFSFYNNIYIYGCIIKIDIRLKLLNLESNL